MEKTTKAGRPWLVGSIAWCHHCRWSSKHKIKAQSEAREHAKETRHAVTVESVYRKTYPNT